MKRSVTTLSSEKVWRRNNATIQKSWTTITTGARGQESIQKTTTKYKNSIYSEKKTKVMQNS